MKDYSFIYLYNRVFEHCLFAYFAYKGTPNLPSLTANNT